MVNKNDLDMTRIESPWSQSGTHTLIFFLLPVFLSGLAMTQPGKVRENPIFEATDRQQTDRQTD